MCEAGAPNGEAPNVTFKPESDGCCSAARISRWVTCGSAAHDDQSACLKSCRRFMRFVNIIDPGVDAAIVSRCCVSFGRRLSEGWRCRNRRM